MLLVRYNHFLHYQFLCYVVIALIFIKIGLKLSYFCQKNTKFSSAWGSAHHTLCFRWLGALPADPSCLRWLGIRSHNAPSHCRFLATGLHEEKIYCTLLPDSIYIRFNFKYAWNVWRRCSHSQRCIIRPKVFHPVILHRKIISRKTFHLYQPRFGFGLDEVFCS